MGKNVAVTRLLAKLMEVAGKEGHSRDSQRLVKAKQTSDLCHVCKATIEDQCIKHGEYRWHVNCFCCRQCKRNLSQELSHVTFSSATLSAVCTQCAGVGEDQAETFEYVTKLTQYAYLLRVALSRLCNFLQITGKEERGRFHERLNPCLDNQLSSMDFSIKTKTHLPKDMPSTKEVTSSPTALHSGRPIPGDEKTALPSYPTHISDVKHVQATNLNRKVSRSFKTAKRNTIMGNAENNPRVSTDTIPENEDGNQHVPARHDSLLRRLDQHKVLPPLPAEEQNQQQQQENQKQLRLDDLPKVAAKSFGENHRPSIHDQPSMKMGGVLISQTTSKPRVYLSELSALQYMIIRHVAVVHIEPYVREHFSLSELLNLIDTKKASIWGKFFTSLMHGTKKPTKVKEDGTFGVSLDVLTEKTGVESNLAASPSPVRVAAFIDDAVTAMRQMGKPQR